MQIRTVKYRGKEIKVRVRDDADESVFNEIFKYFEYRSADEIILNAKFPIVDVGAHAGFFSIYAKILNSTVKILALEPEPENLQVLEKNLNLNDLKDVTISPFALSAKTGNRRLMLSKNSHNHRLSENENVDDSISIKCVNWPDLLLRYNIKSISLLKMDVEGAEYEIFNSLNADDLGAIGAVIMEYHNEEQINYKRIETKLRENGFSVQIFPSKFDRTMGILFARNKKFGIM